jgi:hypothetical protein
VAVVLDRVADVEVAVTVVEVVVIVDVPVVVVLDRVSDVEVAVADVEVTVCVEVAVTVVLDRVADVEVAVAVADAVVAGGSVVAGHAPAPSSPAQKEWQRFAYRLSPTHTFAPTCGPQNLVTQSSNEAVVVAWSAAVDGGDAVEVEAARTKEPAVTCTSSAPSPRLLSSMATRARKFGVLSALANFLPLVCRTLAEKTSTNVVPVRRSLPPSL